MENKKRHIAVFFLVFFITIKMFSLHFITHDEESHYADCDICEYVITTTEVPFALNHTTLCELPIAFQFKEKFSNEYAYQFEQNVLETSLFSRPPPMM